MKISDRLKSWRVEKPSEWELDEIIMDVKALEESIENMSEDVDLLNALQCAGVDSWDGYEGAQELLELWQQEK